MHQQLFNNSLLHVSAQDLSRTTGRARWVRENPSYVAILYCVEGYAAESIVRDAMKDQVVRGWSINDLLDTSWRPFCLVSLVYHGLVRRSGRQWQIIAEPDAKPVRIDVYPNSDLLVMLGSVPDGEVVENFAAYARTYRHSTVTYPAMHSSTRTSEPPS